MKLYFSPGACSIGIHILLEEIGEPYEIQKLNLKSGDQHSPAYTSINPKAKVPVLVRRDGWVLTEFPAIAIWLAQTFPDRCLLGTTLDDAARVIEIMEYLISSIHMQGLHRIFRPMDFTSQPSDYQNQREKGLSIVKQGLALTEQRLREGPYLLINFSVADAALFYIELSLFRRLGFQLPQLHALHYTRMLQRPAVQRVLVAEGLSLH